MAVFSAKNFPSGVGSNNKFPGAGERTTYAPTDKTSYNFKSGFPMEKDAFMYSQSGAIAKKLKKGQLVHFTFPAMLFKAKDFGISGNATIAGISLKSFNSSIDGYVSISAVTKPAGAAQQRIGAGSKTQDMVGKYILEHAYKNSIPFEDKFVTARPGSTLPDLVMTIDGKRVQFEIKGTNNRTAPITFFDKSVNRRNPPAELIEEIAKVYMDRLKVKGTKVSQGMRRNKIKLNFVGMIDYYKLVDPTYGLAGDPGVIRSGKLPVEFAVTQRDILTDMRKVILEHFAEGGDDYFVIHNRSTNKFEIYFVGGGTAGNILNMPKLPLFTEFTLATYGGASSGSTRVGLKIKL